MENTDTQLDPTMWNNSVVKQTNISCWYLYSKGLDIAVLSLFIQIVGLFFVISSFVMFMKNAALQKISNIFQLSILFSNFVLLLADWSIIDAGPTSCTVFSLLFLSFGSASTFSTVCIAFDRYKKMSKLTGVLTSHKQYVFRMCMIWGTSLLPMTWPVYTLVSNSACVLVDKIASVNSTLKMTTAANKIQGECCVCLFTHGLLYDNLYYSLVFIIVSVFVPVVLKIFFYVKIFTNVKKAYMNSWLNRAAAECSQNSTLIRVKARKANVIQRSTIIGPQLSAPSKTGHILLKGLISVFIVMSCWLPISTYWVLISVWGFDNKYIIQLWYSVLLAKCSAVLNVLYYVSFNVKFRKLYIKTVLAPWHHLARTENADATLRSIANSAITTQMCTGSYITPVGAIAPISVRDSEEDNRKANTVTLDCTHLSRIERLKRVILYSHTNKAPSRTKLLMRRCGVVTPQGLSAIAESQT